jgi:hypothetical protein
VLSDTEREQRSEGSQALHVCPSGKSIIMMKVSIGRTEEFSPYHAVKLSVSVIQTSQLMLYSETTAVCSQIHTKHINTLCGQNTELLNVKLVTHIVTIGL